MTNKPVTLTLELMERTNEHQLLHKKILQKASKIRNNPKSNKLLTAVVILFVLFVLVIFVQKPQIFEQFAATNQQAVGGKCSPVPFYCIMMGPNGGKDCIKPIPCPSPTLPQGFVAQQAPPPPNVAAPPIATSPAQIATKSAQTTCAAPPVDLTTTVTIHFNTDLTTNNGYTIMASDMPALNTYAADLVKYPTAVVTINGYTDNVGFAPGTPGPINTNQALSVARAMAAETYLKSKGATKNTYVIKGNGATNFVAPNGPNGNVLNRRDEITTNLTAKSCTTKSTTPVQPVCSDNENWSGYLNTLPATTQQAEVDSTWTVAAITCSGKEIGISQWPGIDAGNKVIAQVGSMSGCNNGTKTYYSWIVKPPALQALALPAAQYPIKVGDQFTAKITMTSLGKFTTTLTNVTGKWSYSAPMTFSAADSKLALRMDIILEDEGYGVTPNVPGLTQFTSPTNSLNQFSTDNGNLTPFDQAPDLSCTNLNATGGQQQDNTSNLTNDNFTEKWLHM